MNKVKKHICQIHKDIVFYDTGSCPICGNKLTPIAESEDLDITSIQIEQSMVICEKCQFVHDIDESKCRNCGCDLGARIPLDETIQGKRIKILTLFRKEIDKLEQGIEERPASKIPVSDEQYMHTINDLAVFPNMDINDVKKAFAGLPQDPEYLRDGQGKESLSIVLNRLKKIVFLYREMAKLNPSEGFAVGHPFLLETLKHLFKSLVAGARSLSSKTLKVTQELGHIMQDELDKASCKINQFGETIDNVNLPDNEIDLLNRRIRSITRSGRSFIYQRKLDLASISADWIKTTGSIDEMVNNATSYFKHLMRDDPSIIPTEYRAGLIGLVILTTSSADPRGVLNTASDILDLLEKTYKYRENKPLFTDAMGHMIPDIETALDNMYSTGEKLIFMDIDKLANSTRRKFLIGICHSLIEGSLKNLINLPLMASFLKRGKKKNYKEIADTKLGERLSWIGDKGVAPLPESFIKMVRNSYAHQTVDTEKDKIILIDIDPHTKRKKKKTIEEDELLIRIEEMLEICVALTIAANIFLINNHKDFSRLLEHKPSKMVFIESAISFSLGMKGIIEVKMEISDSNLNICGKVHPSFTEDELQDVLSPLCVAAVLLPKIKNIALQIKDDEEIETVLSIDSTSLREFDDASIEYKDMAALRASCCARYNGFLIKNNKKYSRHRIPILLSLLLIEDLIKTRDIIKDDQDINISPQTYLKLLALTKKKLKYANKVVEELADVKEINELWNDYYNKSLRLIGLEFSYILTQSDFDREEASRCFLELGEVFKMLNEHDELLSSD